MTTLFERLLDHERDQILNAAHGELESIAKALGVNYNTLRGERSRWITRTDRPTVTQDQERANIAVPPRLQVVVNKPIAIEQPERWLYATDLHTPHHHEKTVARLVQIATSQDVRTLVIGGDFFDFASASTKHPKTVPMASVQQTLTSGGKLLGFLARYFERIYLVLGNHDQRLAKLVNEADFTFRSVVSAAMGEAPDAPWQDCKVVVSDYPHMLVGPEDTGYVVGHPAKYSDAASSKHLGLVAMKHQRHVLGAHTHLLNRALSPCGKFHVIDPGHCCDVAEIGYHAYSEGFSTFKTWTNGFVYIENGQPFVLSDGWVRWSDYGAE